MSSAGKLVLWGLALGLPINAAVAFLLAKSGEGSPHGGTAWFVFFSVPGLALLGLIMIIAGIVSKVRSKNP